MIGEALIVACSSYILSLIDSIIGTQILGRPLVVATLTGTVLGDWQTGLIMGAALESMYMGFSAIGGTIPVDPATGSTLAVAFAILTGADMNTAIALSLPIASVASVLPLLSVTISSLFEPYFTKVIEQGNDKKFIRLHILVNACIMTLPGCIVLFAGIAFGIEQLQAFMGLLPTFMLHGFEVAGGILPAIGFAILLNMLWDKEIGIFFFTGFVFSKFMQLPTIPLVMLALAIALTIFYLEQKKTPVTCSETEREEDFFNV